MVRSSNNQKFPFLIFTPKKKLTPPWILNYKVGTNCRRSDEKTCNVRKNSCCFSNAVAFVLMLPFPILLECYRSQQNKYFSKSIYSSPKVRASIQLSQSEIRLSHYQLVLVESELVYLVHPRAESIDVMFLIGCCRCFI